MAEESWVRRLPGGVRAAARRQPCDSNPAISQCAASSRSSL